MKTIFSYQQVLTYLKDYYEEKKETSSFSYQGFAKKAGLNSPNYFKLIMDGTRQLTVSNIHAFAKAMELNGTELDYFEALVLENQASLPIEKKYYSKRLKQLRALHLNDASSQIERKKPTETLNSALKSATLLLSSGRNQQTGISSAIKELKIDRKTAEGLLNELLSEQSLTPDEHGTLRRPARHTLMKDPSGSSLKQWNFLKDGLSEGQQIFTERYPKGAARFLSLLCTSEPGSLDDIFDDVRTGVEETVKRYDPTAEKELGVYRVQIQVYRLKENKN